MHAVAARLRRRAGVEHLDRAARVLLVVERQRRAHEDAPAMAPGDLLHLGDAMLPGRDLDYALAPRAHRADQRVELADFADRRRHRHAAPAGMVQRIGGAEPDRPLAHRLGHQPLHLGEFGRSRLFADRGVLAHDRGAHRRMADKHREVGIGRAPPDRGQIFGKALEFPIDAGAQRVDVHALDDGKVAHDQVAQIRRARDDAKAAIPHDRGGDAERGRRRQGRIPGDLRVVMSVDVDDARHQGQPTGVDDPLGLAAELADISDPPLLDRDIRPPRLTPEPVDNRRPADHQIIHANPPP